MLGRTSAALVAIAITAASTIGNDRFSSSELHRAAKRLDDDRQSLLQQSIKAVLTFDKQARDEAVTNLVRTAQQLHSLADKIHDFRIHEARRTPTTQPTKDLLLLRRRLLVDRASLMLMQTELFPPASSEAIAAAAKAEAAIADAMQQIPVGSGARHELHRLLIDAVLRSGQIARAKTDFDRWIPNQKPVNPAWLALQARIEIALGNESASHQILSEFARSNGSSGENERTSPSIDIDLARLEHRLSFDLNEIGSWVETIRQRHGDYAFRRAQAMVLSRTQGKSGALSSDPTWLTAKANEHLRSGKRLRAGAMLAKAALAEIDPDRALQRAIEAAALLVSVDQQPFAADTLIQTARKHNTAKTAPTAHLQAIHLLAESAGGNRIEKLLKAQLGSWPRGAEAKSARDWLYQLLSDQDRLIEAAEFASRLTVDDWNDANLALVSNAWRATFHQAPDAELGNLSRRFLRSTRTWRESHEGPSVYRSLAATLLDRDQLDDLPSDSKSGPFVEAFIQFRREGTTDPALDSPPPELIGDARWRLIRDARRSASQRLAIANLLQTWEQESEPSLQSLEIQLWLAKASEAIRMGDHLIAASNQDFDVIVAVANLLGTSDRPQAVHAAIEHWDRVAAGAGRGSDQWHLAKTSAIRCLREVGEREAANRRGRYILLTVADIDPKWRRYYESVAP